MENKHFDKKIREKLQDFEADFVPNDWNAFEQRLELEHNPATEPELEELYFDSVIQDKLGNLEVPYQAADWQKMDQKLDDNFLLRRKIYKYKILELSLMLLVIFTFLQFIGTGHSSADPAPKAVQTESPIAKLVPELSHDQTDVNTPATVAKKHIQQEQKLRATVSTTPTKPATNSSNLKTQQLGISDLAATLTIPAQRSTTTTLLSASKVFSSFNRISELPLSSQLYPSASSTALAVGTESLIKDYFGGQAPSLVQLETPRSREVSKQAQVTSKVAPTVMGTIIPVDKQSLAPLATDLDATREKTLPYSLPSLKRTGLRFGMFSTIDYNYVLTPYDVIFENEAGTRTALGYSAGFSLGFRFTRFELETGASFAVKKYAQDLNQIVGNGNGLEYLLIDELKDIELNVLKVPLNLRYTFAKFGKWQGYLLSGISLNMAVQANYDRKQTFFTDDTREASARGFRNFKANLDEPLALDNKKYPDGLFEGGNFMENSYFTTNIGLGLERILSPRWSLFVQPSYHHFIQVSEERLGPNKDRINTFSISAGAKVNLR